MSPPPPVPPSPVHQGLRRSFHPAVSVRPPVCDTASTRDGRASPLHRPNTRTWPPEFIMCVACRWPLEPPSLDLTASHQPGHNQTHGIRFQDQRHAPPHRHHHHHQQQRDAPQQQGRRAQQDRAGWAGPTASWGPAEEVEEETGTVLELGVGGVRLHWTCEAQYGILEVLMLHKLAAFPLQASSSAPPRREPQQWQQVPLLSSLVYCFPFRRFCAPSIPHRFISIPLHLCLLSTALTHPPPCGISYVSSVIVALPGS